MRILVGISTLLMLIMLVTCVAVPPIDAPPVAFGEEADPVETQYLYEMILFEVASIGSATPSEQALAEFATKIGDSRICHPENVLFNIQKPSNIIQPLPWTVSLIRSFEQQTRTLYDRDSTDAGLVVYISYLDGMFLEGRRSNLGGLAYGSSAFCVFKEFIDPTKESSVLLHELGHLLKIPLAKRRQDPEHPQHCWNPNCVMYFSSRRGRGKFCKPCQRDLDYLIESTYSK